MRTLHQLLFETGCFLKYPGLIPRYHVFEKSQWLSLEELQQQQEQKLARLVEFCYTNVPYYTRQFTRLGLLPADIRTVRDLEKLPVLNKQIIKANLSDFTPRNLKSIRYLSHNTSGSTGTPFQYRLAIEDWEISLAMMYRDRGHGGYQPGDKLAYLSCRLPSKETGIITRARSFIAGQVSFLCINVTPEKALENCTALNAYHPRFLIGGPLPLSTFAKFVQDNGIKLSFTPRAIFTNGEKLFPHQRESIEAVIKAPVFDLYGLDDGGISASECEEHDGMHIDMERGILECVDSQNRQIINREGRILGTSLQNWAMPLLRYESGDLGIVSDRSCPCGRQLPLLKEVTGRIEGYILTPSGIKIHGTVFQLILAKMGNISQFQVVQDSAQKIVVNIVPEDANLINTMNTDEIGRVVAGVDKNLEVAVRYVNENDLVYTSAGKYKFVINNIVKKTHID